MKAVILVQRRKGRWWLACVARCQVPWAFVRTAAHNPRHNRVGNTTDPPPKHEAKAVILV